MPPILEGNVITYGPKVNLVIFDERLTVHRVAGMVFMAWLGDGHSF